MVNKLIKEDTKMFLTGNEVLAYAANSAEAEFMYGYPITPQNEIMHTWCKLLPKTGAGFLQTEDEISAGFSTIGGILAGKRAFTATAGPGNVIMQDAQSMAEMMRIPFVCAVMQRGGPSTATVIYAQQETRLTCFGGNGEGFRIVYSTAGHQDLYDYMIKAFNTAWKYRFPTYVLADGYQGKIMLVEDEWNVQSSNFTNRSSYTRTPKAIHFVAKKKPWHYASFSVHRPLYFKYLQLTPWKLSEKDLKHWTHDNQIASLIEYVKYRPLFLFRPRFYEALFETYIKPCFEYKKPVIKSKTFIVWEPCSKSHSEVVPGYVKYLLDLGYHVSVIVNPQHYKSGLFSRFEDKNLTLNKMSRKEVKEFFRKNNLKDVSGVLVTTSGKLCDSIHYEQCYESFNPEADKSKLFFVEHEVKHSVDAGTWRKDIITLRKLNYKEADSVVVNPHYFGEVKLTPKNSDIVNFVTVGAIQGKKKNNDLIINSVKELHEKGIRNFKITVIGKGHLKKLPKELQQYFDIKGRLPFDKMYDEIEKADFLITSYDETKPGHIRYNTTGTSGNFQLVYGFAKPCIIIESFGPINGFDSSNSILYKTDSEFANALQKGIEMSSEKYSELQKNLKAYADKLYENSKENLRKLITTKGGINE